MKDTAVDVGVWLESRTRGGRREIYHITTLSYYGSGFRSAPEYQPTKTRFRRYATRAKSCAAKRVRSAFPRV